MPRQNTRVAGHSLEWEGAPHDERGRRLSRAYPMEKGGDGRGKCSCGELSPILPSKGARQRWHKDHKRAVNAGAWPPPTRPRIVVLCGSTRFPEAFIQATREKTLAGEIVLSVGLFGHQEGMDMKGEVKQRLDDLHKRKIDISDYVHVLNVGGYIGESTRSEIEYATALGKPVEYMEER